MTQQSFGAANLDTGNINDVKISTARHYANLWLAALVACRYWLGQFMQMIRAGSCTLVYQNGTQSAQFFGGTQVGALFSHFGCASS